MLLPISIAFLAFISFARLAMNWDCSQATIMTLEEWSMVFWKLDCKTQCHFSSGVCFFCCLKKKKSKLSSYDLKSSPLWDLSELDAPSRSDWGHTASAGPSHSDFWWCSFWKIFFPLRVNRQWDTITKNMTTDKLPFPFDQSINYLRGVHILPTSTDPDCWL